MMEQDLTLTRVVGESLIASINCPLVHALLQHLNTDASVLPTMLMITAAVQAYLVIVNNVSAQSVIIFVNWSSQSVRSVSRPVSDFLRHLIVSYYCYYQSVLLM